MKRSISLFCFGSCLFLSVSARQLLRNADSEAYIQEMVNTVSQDSLISYIGALQSFGTRYQYTPQQELAATYIFNSMANTSAQVTSDDYAFGTNVFYDVDLVDKDKIRIVGSARAAAYSNDGGTSWMSGTIPYSTSHLYGVDFIDAQHGWAVGINGTIIATTDGGANWTAQISVGYTLYDVAFIDDTAGIAVGQNGKILRTSDGGTSWYPIASGTLQYLRELCYIDGAHLWAVGDTGTILFSSDRGVTWIPQVSGTSSTLMGADFYDHSNGWSVGYKGTILQTTDGGAHWNIISPPRGIKTYFRSACFWSSTQGLMLDRYGIVFKTTDGGTTWTQTYSSLNLGWGPVLNRIKRFGTQRFVAVGERGWIITSTDGGDSWYQQTQNLPSSLIHNTRNIVATIPGNATPQKECVMVAHYDSYSTTNVFETAPGANDNGTGTSAVMEAVRVLNNYNFESTVKLIAVSAEELGMYGSSHYVLRALEQKKILLVRSMAI